MDGPHALSELVADFQVANNRPENYEKQMKVERAATLSSDKIGIVLKRTSKTSNAVQLLMAILYDTTAGVAAEEVIRSFNSGVSTKQYGGNWRLVSIGKPVSEIGSYENLRTLLETDWISWFITPVGQAEQAWNKPAVPIDLTSLPAVEPITVPVPDFVPSTTQGNSPFGPVKPDTRARLLCKKLFGWFPWFGYKI